MKKILFLISLLTTGIAYGQELYVYTEPASNIPARSLSTRISVNGISKQRPYYRSMQRYQPSVMLGLNKNWMIAAGATIADMHTSNTRWESLFLYGKYRFLSHDNLHSHFRMAVFGEVAYTRSPFHFDEVSLQGDKDGVQLGLIATQLWHKLAVSASVSHTQVLHASRTDKVLYQPSRIYQVMNYSLSAGYLVLPVTYKSYKQTNLNLYAEMLAQQSLDRKAWYVDLAPAVQLIFNSNTKVNFGYRMQLDARMQRMARNSWLVTVERTFLNALKKKKAH